MKNKNLLLDGLDGFFRQSTKAEANFLRLPYFCLSRCLNDHFKPISLEENVTRNGVRSKIKWSVTPNHELGLPGMLERELMFFILRLADEARKYNNNQVPEKLELGSLYDICKELGLYRNSRIYDRIKKGLQRLGGTMCVSQGAFYLKTAKKFIDSTQFFSFLSEVYFKGESDINGDTVNETYVQLHEFVRKNLDVYYVKTIDLTLMRSLKTDTAPLLYPHLSITFDTFERNQQYWEVNYKWLAKRLGIKVEKLPSYAKQQLKAAHDELVRINYIQQPIWDNFKIQYIPGSVALEEVKRNNVNKTMAKETQTIAYYPNSTITKQLLPKENNAETDGNLEFLRMKLNLHNKFENIKIEDKDLIKVGVKNIEELKILLNYE